MSSDQGIANITFFRSITTDERVLRDSSSGGLAFECAKEVISDGGIVYGVGWDIETQSVRYKRIGDASNLVEIQGSLYVHGETGKSVWNSLRSDLATRKTLVIGLPCQIAAVRKVARQSENLLCIDLICHGVPESKLWKEEMSNWKIGEVRHLRFRRGLEFVLEAEGTKGTKIEQAIDNPYFALFLMGVSYRKCCYACIFAHPERVGDLTLGDYVEDGKGYSACVVNTKNGLSLVERVRHRVEFEERSIDLLKENLAFWAPTVRHKRADFFWQIYSVVGLKFAFWICFPILRLKRCIRIVIGPQRYERLKNFVS